MLSQNKFLPAFACKNCLKTRQILTILRDPTFCKHFLSHCFPFLFSQLRYPLDFLRFRAPKKEKLNYLGHSLKVGIYDVKIRRGFLIYFSMER